MYNLGQSNKELKFETYYPDDYFRFRTCHYFAYQHMGFNFPSTIQLWVAHRWHTPRFPQASRGFLPQTIQEVMKTKFPGINIDLIHHKKMKTQKVNDISDKVTKAKQSLKATYELRNTGKIQSAYNEAVELVALAREIKDVLLYELDHTK